MFLNKVLELFERYVVAHESLAQSAIKAANPVFTVHCGGPEAQADLMRTDATPDSNGNAANMFTPVPQQAQAPEQAPAPSAVPPRQEAAPAPEPSGKATWDPYTAPPQSKYGGAKPKIMTEELAKHGIEVPARWTGKMMHQRLLELGPVGSAPAQAPAPAAEPVPQNNGAAMPPAGAAAPTPQQSAAPSPPISNGQGVTVDLLRETAKGMVAKPALQAQTLALLTKYCGQPRLTDPNTGASLVTVENMGALYSELVALDAGL